MCVLKYAFLFFEICTVFSFLGYFYGRMLTKHTEPIEIECNFKEYFSFMVFTNVKISFLGRGPQCSSYSRHRADEKQVYSILNFETHSSFLNFYLF